MTTDKRPAQHTLNIDTNLRRMLDGFFGTVDKESRQKAILNFLKTLNEDSLLTIDEKLKKAKLKNLNLDAAIKQQKLVCYDSLGEVSNKAARAIKKGMQTYECKVCNEPFDINSENIYDEILKHMETTHHHFLSGIQKYDIRREIGV